MCMWVHVYVYEYKVCTHTTNKVYVLTKFHSNSSISTQSSYAVQVNNNMKGEVNTMKKERKQREK